MPNEAYTIITPEDFGLQPVYLGASFNASVGKLYMINTLSQEISATLDPTLQKSGRVRFLDVAGNAANNNIIIIPSGSTINGNPDSLRIDRNFGEIELTYSNDTSAWYLKRVCEKYFSDIGTSYYASPGDVLSMDVSAGSFDVYLPDYPLDYSQVTLIDHIGYSQNNPVTVHSGSGETIEGNATWTFSSNGEDYEVLFWFDSLSSEWKVSKSNYSFPLLTDVDGSPKDITGNDLNNYTKSGILRGSSLINAPNTNNFFVFVIAQDSNNIIQVAWDVSTAAMYNRSYTGSWSSWVAAGGDAGMNPIVASLIFG